MAVIDWWNGPLTLFFCNFLCIVLAAAYLKYRLCRLSCLPPGTFFSLWHTHTPLRLQLSRLLPVATDDDGDRRRRRPDATECTGSLRLRCHPQVSALSIASCQLELRPSLHCQLLSSPPVIDVDRDRIWGDGLAASSPVGLCRKFRREDSQKARLERKRAAVEHRDVQHRVSGFVGFRSSATRLCSSPAAAGLPLTAEKSFPVVKWPDDFQ